MIRRLRAYLNRKRIQRMQEHLRDARMHLSDIEVRMQNDFPWMRDCELLLLTHQRIALTKHDIAELKQACGEAQ